MSLDSRASIPDIDSLAHGHGNKSGHASVQPRRYALLKHYLGHPHRLAQFLMLQRVTGYDVPNEPHLDELARPLFDDLLRECSGYLEFGSGGSTVLADRLGKRAIAVESDRYFARAVRASLREQSGTRILDVDVGLTGPWSYPLFDWPTARRLRKWAAYSSSAFELLRQQGWFPDFVFVDGRFRRACVLQTIRAAHAAGQEVKILFDDYFLAGRGHYHSVENLLGVPQRAGRAALFIVRLHPSELPSDEEIAETTADYR